jgi:hypothetical protein
MFGRANASVSISNAIVVVGVIVVAVVGGVHPNQPARATAMQT